MRSRGALAGLVVLGAGLLPSTGVAAQTGGRETIVFIRHGEKPDGGLGQLSCRGLNRALALPAILESKFGKAAAVFAPDPSKRKVDEGKPYDYVRPLATIEPTAIKLGLPVDTSYGFLEIDKLQQALEQPALHEATVVVAWEHKLVDALVKTLLTSHGGDTHAVPKWDSDDFDGIYVVTLDWSGAAPGSSFRRDHQGLSALSAECPR